MVLVVGQVTALLAHELFVHHAVCDKALQVVGAVLLVGYNLFYNLVLLALLTTDAAPVVAISTNKVTDLQLSLLLLESDVRIYNWSLDGTSVVRLGLLVESTSLGLRLLHQHRTCSHLPCYVVTNTAYKELRIRNIQLTIHLVAITAAIVIKSFKVVVLLNIARHVSFNCG